MKDISLKTLLEAGCHFGHKVSRWHPKAKTFIYESREGIHIIDLAQTRDGLKKGAVYAKKLAEEGKILLVVATKRQAKGVVSEAAKKAGVPYLTNRWVGGMLTNWEEVKKNIDKVNRMRDERTNGSWKKFPKHEQIALEKDLRKLETIYSGVAELVKLPDALFIVDIKTEHIALKEASRKSIPVIAVVDTNADPNNADYPIPANDDAVGSIECLTNYIVESYAEGRDVKEKTEGRDQKAQISPPKADLGQRPISLWPKPLAENIKDQSEIKKEVNKPEEKPAVAKAMAGKEEKKEVNTIEKAKTPKVKKGKTKKA